MKVISILLSCTLLLQLLTTGWAASMAAMSLDLGNEFIKIGIVSPGKLMETVLNSDSSRKTPMIVGFRDGVRYFGEAALSLSVRFPNKVFTNLLDLIGKPIDHSLVQLYKQRFPYHNITAHPTITNSLLITHPEGDQFTPEELLAMVLERTRLYAEEFLGNKLIVRDLVIVVPSFFTQSERIAVENAAKIARLNLLQLTNSNTAVGINYGLYRLKDFKDNESKNIVFYGMGSSATEVHVVSYQLRKKNEGAYPTTVPELIIRGVGYDRVLGGFEMQLRLRDLFAKSFSEQSKIPLETVTSNQRAMSKLLKEAGRVKVMLSANSEISARVENVMNDVDLKIMVKRQEYEDICEDLYKSRVTQPLQDALLSSGLTIQDIEQVVLFGGNTRTPKIQKTLNDFLNLELSKSINSDEASSLGAAYISAGLSKGFMIKPFDIKEQNLFPVTVDFVRTVQETGKTKNVQRILFAKGNSYPVRKVLTFNKPQEEFEFYINYGEMSFLTPVEEANAGLKNLSKVIVQNVKKTIDLYEDKRFEHKGLKAHFNMNKNGVLELEKMEYVVSEEVQVPVKDDKDSASADTLAKLGNKISNFFSSKNSNIVGDTLSNLGESVSNFLNKGQTANESETVVEVDVNGEESGKSEDVKSEDIKSENVKSEDTKSEDTKSEDIKSEDSKLEGLKEEEKAEENESEVKYKIEHKTIKVPMAYEEIKYSSFYMEDEMNKSIEKLTLYSKKEADLLRKDRAKNSLESFIVENRARLYEDEYEKASTEEHREKFNSKLSEISEWLEYESDNADTKEFEDKLELLNQEFKDLFFRVHEHRNRPEIIEALNNLLNISSKFLKGIQDLKEEDQIFTEVELKKLDETITSTLQWRDEKLKEQETAPLYETPKMTISSVKEKIYTLDREFKYLVNKAQIAPKKKAAEKKKEAEELKKQKEDQNKEQMDESEKSNETAEKEQPDEPVPTEPKMDSSHSEL